jgi:hypothetical protein
MDPVIVETTHDQPTVTLSFRRGDASAQELQEVVDALLRELDDGASQAAEAARAAGLDARALAGARVTVREPVQGADSVLTEILVGITVGGGTRVAETLWRAVVWPRVRRRLGAYAIDVDASGSA